MHKLIRTLMVLALLLTLGTIAGTKMFGSSSAYAASDTPSETADDDDGVGDSDDDDDGVGDSDDDDDGVGDSDDDDDGNESYGRINSMPAGGTTGTWVINGVSYNATATTQIEAEHGAFGTGVCVEVYYDSTTSPFTAREIESERDGRCVSNSSAPAPSYTRTGVIENMGAARASTENGQTWVIGGQSYLVYSDTVLDGSLAVGQTVQVNGYTSTTDNQDVATQIQAQAQNVAATTFIFMPLIQQ